jgi:hypothetical protein
MFSVCSKSVLRCFNRVRNLSQNCPIVFAADNCSDRSLATNECKRKSKGVLTTPYFARVRPYGEDQERASLADYTQAKRAGRRQRREGAKQPRADLKPCDASRRRTATGRPPYLKRKDSGCSTCKEAMGKDSMVFLVEPAAVKTEGFRLFVQRLCRPESGSAFLHLVFLVFILF